MHLYWLIIVCTEEKFVKLQIRVGDRTMFLYLPWDAAIEYLEPPPHIHATVQLAANDRYRLDKDEETDLAGVRRYLERRRRLFYDFVRGAREHEVKEMVLGQEGRGSVLFKERDLNGEMRYSPDGRWIAYVTGASGSLEVWIRSATGGSPRIASRGGGKSPAWSRDGGRLYFQQDDAILEVGVSGEQVPAIGRQKAVVDLPPGVVAWDTTPRAGEFVATQRLPGVELPSQIHVILDWFEEVRRLAGSAG